MPDSAGVQGFLDPHLAVLGDADEAGARVAHGLDHAQDVRRLEAAVLHVEEEPVEAGVRGDLGQLRRGQAEQRPDEPVALEEPLAETGAHRWKLWPMNFSPSTIPVRQ